MGLEQFLKWNMLLLQSGKMPKCVLNKTPIHNNHIALYWQNHILPYISNQPLDFKEEHEQKILHTIGKKKCTVPPYPP